MNKSLNKKLLITILSLITAIFTTSAYADTQKLIIESGDNAQNRQQTEKERDKKYAAIDASYACQTSGNLNAH